MGSDKARPAYVDDVDETSGKAVRGTRRSASTREKPTVHRDSRPSKPRRAQTESVSPTDQITTALQHVDSMNREQDMKLERRMSTTSRSPRKSTRPPSSHETRGYPKLQMPTTSPRDEQSYYGIPTPTTVSSSTVSQPISLAHRPRALTAHTYPRPQSYHSSQGNYGPGPPLSMSAYYQQPQQMVAPSYPPPQYNVQYTPALQAPQQQPDYFGNQSQQLVSRPLASRFEMVRSSRPTFDPISRTTSAFGTRDMMPSPSEYDDDGYNSAAESATTRRTRRPSILRGPPMSRADEDALAMPPPASRPGILRRTTDYPIEAPDPHEYRLSRSEYPEPSRPRRPSGNRHSVSYDMSTGIGGGRVTVEPANSSRRRQSWYDQPESTASSGYEAQLTQAASYQEDVTGAPSVPLTAEMLRKQQKREVGSSRSTKSSNSRDDSDYKQSATTRTTRSGSGDDENMTIKVTGQARVTVGGAQIECTDGGAIEINQKKNMRTGSETASKKSNSVYGGRRIEERRIEDNRRSRDERPPARSRMGSTTGRSSYPRKSIHQYPANPDYF